MPKCLNCKRNFDRTRKYPVQNYCCLSCGNLYRVRTFRKKRKEAEKDK